MNFWSKDPKNSGKNMLTNFFLSLSGVLKKHLSILGFYFSRKKVEKYILPLLWKTHKYVSFCKKNTHKRGFVNIWYALSRPEFKFSQEYTWFYIE